MATFLPILQFHDPAFTQYARPLSLGYLYFYDTGTTTPKATYTDAGAGTQHAHPIVLNSAGQVEVSGVVKGIWLSSTGAYRLVIKNAAGTTLQTLDNVTGVGAITGDLTLTGTLTAANVTVSSIFAAPSITSIAGSLTSTTDKVDYKLFLGAEKVFKASAGTWTLTRNAQGDYSLDHTVANDTAILSIDATEAIRTNTNKGYKLTSIAVAYSIATNALDAHSVTVAHIVYANNSAVAVTNMALTGSLATATQAQPYLSSITINSPVFLNNAAQRMIVELTVDNNASSVYKFYGLNLGFSRNDL